MSIIIAGVIFISSHSYRSNYQKSDIRKTDHPKSYLYVDFWNVLDFVWRLQLFASGKWSLAHLGSNRVLHLFVHSPNGCNSESWADPKLGDRRVLWVSHLGAGTQGLGLFYVAFPGHQQECGSEVEEPEHKPAPTGDSGAPCGRLVCYAIMPTPQIFNVFFPWCFFN